MTQTITEERKAKLIEQYRNINVEHVDWWDSVYDDFQRICTILGIKLEQREVRTMSGKTRYEPNIEFSGFCSQGDGASWAGTYWAWTLDGATYQNVYTYDIAPAKIREYCSDEELHRIADELCLLARIYYPTYARVTKSGRYSHSNTMTIDHYEDMNDLDPDTVASEVHSHVEETLLQLFRDLADWLYDTLEKEYDYQTSDEAVWDAIEANELDEIEEEEEA